MNSLVVTKYNNYHAPHFLNFTVFLVGAPTWIRTRDKLLKRELLYQLSYERVKVIVNVSSRNVYQLLISGS